MIIEIPDDLGEKLRGLAQDQLPATSVTRLASAILDRAEAACRSDGEPEGWKRRLEHADQAA